MIFKTDQSANWMIFKLTNQLPLSVVDEAADISGVRLQLKIDTGAVVRPRTELQLTELVVKGKPGDVDHAGAEEETWRNPETFAGGEHHDIRWKGAVDIFVGATVRHSVNISDPCIH